MLRTRYLGEEHWSFRSEFVWEYQSVFETWFPIYQQFELTIRGFSTIQISLGL
jgi:hypothetical protein